MGKLAAALLHTGVTGGSGRALRWTKGEQEPFCGKHSIFIFLEKAGLQYRPIEDPYGKTSGYMLLSSSGSHKTLFRMSEMACTFIYNGKNLRVP